MFLLISRERGRERERNKGVRYIDQLPLLAPHPGTKLKPRDVP